MNKGRIIILILVLLVLSVGSYFRDDILGLYNNFWKNLDNLNKTGLESILKEIKTEVYAPSPLNVGGRETPAVLTKAKIIAQTNIQRYNNDLLIPLIENSKLNAAALAKANDMFLNQYFEHISPSGVDPGELVKNYGYDYIIAGENLILGNFESEKEVVQHWMESPDHRANILNKRFTEIGVAIVKGTYKGQTSWIGVQEFGLPLSACSQPESELKNQIDYNKSRLDVMSLELDAKKQKIDNASPRSQKYNELIDEYNQLAAEYNTLLETTKNLILQFNNQVNIFNQCAKGS